MLRKGTGKTTPQDEKQIEVIGSFFLEELTRYKELGVFQVEAFDLLVLPSHNPDRWPVLTIRIVAPEFCRSSGDDDRHHETDHELTAIGEAGMNLVYQLSRSFTDQHPEHGRIRIAVSSMNNLEYGNFICQVPETRDLTMYHNVG